jgi:hypothetical protein
VTPDNVEYMCDRDVQRRFRVACSLCPDDTGEDDRPFPDLVSAMVQAAAATDLTSALEWCNDYRNNPGPRVLLVCEAMASAGLEITELSEAGLARLRRDGQPRVTADTVTLLTKYQALQGVRGNRKDDVADTNAVRKLVAAAKKELGLLISDKGGRPFKADRAGETHVMFDPRLPPPSRALLRAYNEWRAEAPR